jgi:FtsP/CotA-like multicopper oxidase with cupredoxin domain
MAPSPKRETGSSLTRLSRSRKGSRARCRRRSLAQPGPRARRLGRAQEFEFNIQRTRASIYNPAADKDDKIDLRSYHDVRETAPPKIPFVAPTIEVFPGDTVRITLNNKLEADPSCAKPGNDVNEPNCYKLQPHESSCARLAKLRSSLVNSGPSLSHSGKP